MFPSHVSRRAVLFVVGSFICAASLLTGCGTGEIDHSETPTRVATTISGKVYGGEQPISGATIQLWETGTSGYGSGATLLESCGLTANTTGTFTCPTANVPSNCTGGPYAYITAAGGDPTGQTQTAQNHALLNTAILGTCTSVGANTYVTINEVTTVAAAYTMSNFATVSGAGGTLATLNIGAPASNSQGLADAVANAALLVNSQYGQATNSTVARQVPTATINSLANTTAACTNASDYNVAPCTTFFGYATPPGGTQPTNSFQALMNIAKYPGQNVTSILQLAPTNSPFYPILTGGSTTSTSTSVLNDLSLGIAYTDSTLALTSAGTGVVGLTIDGSDDVWVLGATNGSYNYITELTSASAGSTETDTLGSTSTLASTQTIRNGAFDTLGNLFITDNGLGSLIEITPTSGVAGATALPTFSTLGDGAGGTVGSNDYAVAIDASNNPYTVSYAGQGNCHMATSTNTPACEFIKYAKSGSTYTPTNLFSGAQAGAPSVRSMAVDNVSSSSGLGNVWAPSIGNTSNSKAGTVVSVLKPSTGALAVITINSSTNLTEPYGVALDKSGNGYVTTEATGFSGLYYVPQGTANAATISSTVSTSGTSSTLKYIANTTSSPASSATTSVALGGFNNPYYDAVDGAGNVWIANNNAASIVEYSPSISGFLSPYYGFTPSIAVAQTATVTAYSITSNVVTFTANEAFTAGETLTLSSFPTSTFFNGQTVTVSATGLTTTSFQANFTHANVSATTEAGLATSAVNASNQALFTCTTVSGTTTCGVFGLANKHSLQPLSIDRAGSVWSMDSAGTLLEIIGTAAPTNPVLAAGQSGSQP